MTAWPEPTLSVTLPAEVEAYCVKCRASRIMQAAQLVMTKTGKVAAKGKCPVDGTAMMKFLPAR